MVLRAMPPRNGANPAIAAPTRFSTPMVEARRDGRHDVKSGRSLIAVDESGEETEGHPCEACRIQGYGWLQSGRCWGPRQRTLRTCTQNRAACHAGIITVGQHGSDEQSAERSNLRIDACLEAGAGESERKLVV